MNQNKEEIETKIKPLSELITSLEDFLKIFKHTPSVLSEEFNKDELRDELFDSLNQAIERLKEKDENARRNIELSANIIGLEDQLKKQDEHIILLRKQIKFMESRMKGGFVCEFLRSDKCTALGDWLLITTFLEHEPEQRNSICSECKELLEEKISKTNQSHTRFEKLEKSEIK